MNEHDQNFSFLPFLALLALCLFLSFFVPSDRGTLKDPLYAAVLVTLLIPAAAWWIAKRKGASAQKTGMKLIPFVIGAGAFVKVAYILYTRIYERQHDVVDFNVGEGQAAYIEYFLQNKHLPDFDPRSVWGFFQPPLHHIIASVWMRVNYKLGLAERQVQENVQALTLFYIVALVILTWYVCRELKLSDTAAAIAVSIVSFHPVFILLSGSINNDALSLFLMMIALYLAVLWAKREKMWLIILLALAIGLAMFAKLSGGMIAPAVGVLFLYKLIKEKEKRGRLLLQYVIFAIICVPVGLFWTVRNKILFDMPVNYIPEVGQQFEQTSFFDRFLDFRMESVFPAMKEYGYSFYEHNVFLAMLKTSLFGEYDFGMKWSGFTALGILLFAVALLLALLASFATIRVILRKDSFLKPEWKWFFGTLIVTLLVSYFSFALSASNFSAQDFRYAALLIVPQALMLGIFTDTDPLVTDHPVAASIIKGATGFFAACSFITYLLVGFF